MNTLGKRDAVEIKIGNVPLAWKLDAIAAALAAVLEAHRDTISQRSWAAVNRARDNLYEAMIGASDSPANGGQRAIQPQEALCGRRNAPAYHQPTTPAGDVVTPAGTGDVP